MSTSHPSDTWHPPLLWRLLLVLSRLVVGVFARLEVTGEVPAGLRRGPLILAANHIGPGDPVALVAACGRVGIAPRVMATGGLFQARLVGSVMRACGHIRVDRREVTVAQALTDAVGALGEGSVVVVYPEGRISLDPGLWPERGRTGVARLALASGAPVVPVAQWGAHETMPYSSPTGMARGLLRSMVRRPRVRIHFGAPVSLGDLRSGAPGHALRATERILDAITADLVVLRADEPGLPRHVDPSRPVSTERSRAPGLR